MRALISQLEQSKNRHKKTFEINENKIENNLKNVTALVRPGANNPHITDDCTVSVEVILCAKKEKLNLDMFEFYGQLIQNHVEQVTEVEPAKPSAALQAGLMA